MLVRDRLALPDSGDLRDQVIQAFEVLDVERRPYVDARIAQFRDVLPAFGMAWRRIALDEIRMRQFVHQQDLRPTLQCGVQVEFLAHACRDTGSAASAGIRAFRAGARFHDGRAARHIRRPRRYPRPWPRVPPRASHRSCRRRPRRRRTRAGGRASRAPPRPAPAPAVDPDRGDRRPSVDYVPASSARLSSSTLTRGSPRKPSVRPSVAS